MLRMEFARSTFGQGFLCRPSAQYIRSLPVHMLLAAEVAVYLISLISVLIRSARKSRTRGVSGLHMLRAPNATHVILHA